jgi:hypothetical protein
MKLLPALLLLRLQRAEARENCDCAATTATCTAVVNCSGTIPSRLAANLPAVTAIALVGGADVWGTIPSSLASLTALASITMSGVQLSGTIPACFASLESLVALQLRDLPHLTGFLPAELGTLTALTVLDVSRDAIVPVMPASMCSLGFDKLTFCNLSAPAVIVSRVAAPATTAHVTGGSSSSASEVDEKVEKAEAGWDCSALPTECAQRLRALCGAGQHCVETSRRAPPEAVLYALVAVAGTAAVCVTVAGAVLYDRWRRASGGVGGGGGVGQGDQRRRDGGGGEEATQALLN